MRCPYGAPAHRAVPCSLCLEQHNCVDGISSNEEFQYGYVNYRHEKANAVFRAGRLFVSEGVAAFENLDGLYASGDFFRLLFPAMLGVLIVFRVGIWLSGDRMRRPFGKAIA